MFFLINGGNKMKGELDILSAKNSILPLIAASVLSTQTVVIKNCPPLLDVFAMLDIIKSIGGFTLFENGTITINCKDVVPKQIDSELTNKLRSSVFILGPLLSRFKTAAISHPGGCKIGTRPIDLHIEGLKQLGVKKDNQSQIINCKASSLNGTTIHLKMPSVGATENLMMAAVLAKGETVITNAALEPEIEDLAKFINVMGGKIAGAGTKKIIINGVKSLNGCEFTPIADRIVAGTYLSAAAMCGGKIQLKNVNFKHIYSVINKLMAAGCRFNFKQNSVTIISGGIGSLKAIKNTQTKPYPGFPTDMQPQLCALLSIASGTSIVAENLFENRFRFTNSLKKMGADITLQGKKAIINGVNCLNGAKLESEDLRGGAALVLAALSAQGKSIVEGIQHIDRGYYKMEQDLKLLNCDIIRKSS